MWSVHLYFIDTEPIPIKYIGLCFSCSETMEQGGIHKMSQNVLNVFFFALRKPFGGINNFSSLHFLMKFISEAMCP